MVPERMMYGMIDASAEDKAACAAYTQNMLSKHSAMMAVVWTISGRSFKDWQFAEDACQEYLVDTYHIVWC